MRWRLGTRRFSTASTMKYLFGMVGAFAVMGLLSTAPSYADIVFMDGNDPQHNETNILFGAKQSGSTVTGTGNTSGVVVDFSSTTDTLMTSASGQAKVSASDGLINDISITSPGNSFTDLIFNPEHGTGVADVMVTASDGSFSFSYALRNGNNFLTIFATGGETISGVTIDASAGFADLKQPRISGLAATSPVPEPPTFLLVALPLVGIAVIRREEGVGSSRLAGEDSSRIGYLYQVTTKGGRLGVQLAGSQYCLVKSSAMLLSGSVALDSHSHSRTADRHR
jgi:hypothetical protein